LRVVPESLDDWLAYQTQVHSQTIDLGLARLRTVLERLRWRQPTVPVITVAGTNGKGSVAAYSSAILSAAGRRVGAFTSPHLRDYRERIRVDDRLVTTEELLGAFGKIEAARGEVPLTFFEYNTLAALLIFEGAELDALVLEIGMGGRLDAVNVVDPSVAVVVSIGFDHQQYLGTTLESIGAEKAGIFRSSKPAVLGSRRMPAVLERTARTLGAPLKRLGAEFDYERGEMRWRYRGTRWDLKDLAPPGLFGDAQYDNAATAIAALEELEPRLGVGPDVLARAVASTRLAGRFQVIAAANHARPVWVLDVAHNADAARVLAHNLAAQSVQGRTLGVCGILADKDAAAIIAEMQGCIDEWWFASTEGARGSSGSALAARLAPQLQTPLHACADIPAACAAAAAAATSDDRIVVFGSFHSVGPALDWLESHDMLPSATSSEYTPARVGS
jgi:dihydrofolate synthase/folylpolyglutamate synthase